MHRRWKVPYLYGDLAVCAEWGMSYADYLAQPPQHRAYMREFLAAKNAMAAVEYQEQRDRRAVKGM